VDKAIVCKQCKKEFKISDDQQAWFKAQGFQEPKRCKACRDKRRAEKGEKPGGSGSAPVSAPPKSSTSFTARASGDGRLFNG
jgi:hypothetical protein